MRFMVEKTGGEYEGPFEAGDDPKGQQAWIDAKYLESGVVAVWEVDDARSGRAMELVGDHPPVPDDTDQ
jgi:hypothetical protein